MAGFIRFAAFAVLLVGLLVFVVLPAVASPLLTQMVREQGLVGEDVKVSVGYFDPSIITGRADQLRVQGRNIEVAPATIGFMDLTFGGVSFLDRRFETVTGELRDVSLHAGGLSITVASVQVSGPAGAANATARLASDAAEELVSLAARREGLAVDRVRLRDGRLQLVVSGVETSAGMSVRGGALVLEPALGPAVVLIQPAPADPWRLTEAWMGAEGITIRGTVDAAALAARVPRNGNR